MRRLHLMHLSERPTAVTISREELLAWLAELDGTGRPSTSQAPLDVEPAALTLFSTNDYLGLSSHPAVQAAYGSSGAAHGSGTRSSAIVSGYSAAHRELEVALATLKGAEDCLLFPTGFAANLAAVSACMAGGDCVVLSDELNHASIIDGARLGSRAGAEAKVYRHNDMGHLEELLRSASGSGKRAMVVTDGLFSMDGDFADLRALATLKRRYGFLLAVDDAHATLVCGERGAGTAAMLGVEESVDLHVGTLSKAVGCLGGFVATTRGMKAWLSNRGRGFVYSTALPVPVAAAAQAALRVGMEEEWRREHVWSLVRRVGEGLGCTASSPIVPVVVGAEQDALAISGQLLRAGFHVPAIRPPTVPRGTSRLRISLSAAHTTEEVDSMMRVLRDGVQGVRLGTTPQVPSKL